jgi:hypothetical protein
MRAADRMRHASFTAVLHFCNDAPHIAALSIQKHAAYNTERNRLAIVPFIFLGPRS